MSGRSRPPLTEIDARRIVLLKPSALGDIVHSLPVLTALRRRFPLAHIRWVVNLSFADLLRGHPDLDEVLTFDRGSSRGGLWNAARSFLDLAEQVRRLRPDLVVDLQGLFRTGLLALLSGAGRRVGLSSAREGTPWFYTDVVRVADFEAIHAVDRLWLLAEALGAGDGPKVFHIPIGDEVAMLGRRPAVRTASAVADGRRRIAVDDQALAAGAFRRAGAAGPGAFRRDGRVHRRRQ